MKEPYCTNFCWKLCRIGQDHAEPGEKQEHRSDRKWWRGYSRDYPPLEHLLHTSCDLALLTNFCTAPNDGRLGTSFVGKLTESRVFSKD